ncbi:hypothetical protein B0H13DRAFT_2002523, partial [Mycena leptocephala]
ASTPPPLVLPIQWALALALERRVRKHGVPVVRPSVRGSDPYPCRGSRDRLRAHAHPREGSVMVLVLVVPTEDWFTEDCAYTTQLLVEWFMDELECPRPRVAMGAVVVVE